MHNCNNKYKFNSHRNPPFNSTVFGTKYSLNRSWGMAMTDSHESINYESALRETSQLRGERVLTIGTVIFSIAFCGLVFYAGWKEIRTDRACEFDGASICQSTTTSVVPRKSIISMLRADW